MHPTENYPINHPRKVHCKLQEVMVINLQGYPPQPSQQAGRYRTQINQLQLDSSPQNASSDWYQLQRLSSNQFDSIIYATNYFICPYKSHANISTAGDSIIRSRTSIRSKQMCLHSDRFGATTCSNPNKWGKMHFAEVCSLQFGGGECAMLLHFARPCSTAARPCMDSQSGCSYSIRKPSVSTRDSLRKKKKYGALWYAKKAHSFLGKCGCCQCNNTTRRLPLTVRGAVVLIIITLLINLARWFAAIAVGLPGTIYDGRWTTDEDPTVWQRYVGVLRV